MATTATRSITFSIGSPLLCVLLPAAGLGRATSVLPDPVVSDPSMPHRTLPSEPSSMEFGLHPEYDTADWQKGGDVEVRAT
jgi:hypothetical protein